MTVSELIAQLANMPPDTPVVVCGYEGGLDDTVAVERHDIVLDYYLPDYYGRHEFAAKARDNDCLMDNRRKSDCTILEAVYIKSGRKKEYAL